MVYIAEVDVTKINTLNYKLFLQSIYTQIEKIEKDNSGKKKVKITLKI